MNPHEKYDNEETNTNSLRRECLDYISDLYEDFSKEEMEELLANWENQLRIDMSEPEYTRAGAISAELVNINILVEKLRLLFQPDYGSLSEQKKLVLKKIIGEIFGQIGDSSEGQLDPEMMEALQYLKKRFSKL